MVGMEVAVISTTLNIVANKIAPLVIKRYSSIVGVKKDLQELHGQVNEINNLLEKSENKAMWSDSSFNWLKRLKDIAYAVDDVVDEFQMKAEKHDAVPFGSGIVSEYMCAKPKSFIFQCKAVSKIKAIKKRFTAIVKERTEFSAIANSLPIDQTARLTNNTTGEMPSLPIVDAASILGRDQEKHQIISKLVETSGQENIRIVTIIGLGGSGKTTLAKLVFSDDNIIGNHFEVRLWVHVSQDFNVEKLVQKLFEAFSVNKAECHTLQYIASKISEKLTGKRFLLVLDDVWTKDQILWGEFMVHLKSGAAGSRILLTTRSSEVAKTVGSTYILDLPLLSPDYSWQLFQQSFITPVKDWDFEFEEVGKEIVRKCGGLPLAIKVLAGALHGKERIEEWHAMRDNNLLDLEGEEQSVSVLGCLRLSYFHLPSHLKHCFTICSVFPKGHLIDKEQLIDLWIAHDMIAPVAGVDHMEYSGHKCFNYLVQISFLQDVDEYYGRVTCFMHDLVHDLARSILVDEISLLVPKDATSSARSFRYFSLTEQPRNLLPKNIFEKARAVYVSMGDDFVLGKALKNAKHLRSITMRSFYTTSVATTILQAKNLRYLSISRMKFEKLPEAISDLWMLQALHVTHCLLLLKLPESIGKLQMLRTLNLSHCKMLESLPDSIGDCHMISSIDLGNCKNFEVLPSSIGRNKKLRVLRLGRTQIWLLPSSIATLENLECLDLRWCHDLLVLPQGIGNLEKLQVLNLEGCDNLRAMPVGIGQLHRVQNLRTFAVGLDERSARISELANVSGISGSLTVRGIARVMDPDDAHRACLNQKTNLKSLDLKWDSENHMDKMSTELEQAVLDGLQPPAGIANLYISGYAGQKYARWMLRQVGCGVQELHQFPCLTVMCLSDFPNLRHLEGLVVLPCLKVLDLSGMPALESISGGPFPLLGLLVMRGMHSLREVWMVTERTLADGEEAGCNDRSCYHLGQMQIGTSLSQICIEGCPKLEVKPRFPISLKYLSLGGECEKLLLSPGQGQGSSPPSSFQPRFSFSHLKELRLERITTSSSSTSEAEAASGLGSGRGWELLQHMTALESLTIYWCVGLTELPLPASMESLTSLQSLRIDLCSAIRMLPECLGQLRSLQQMSITSCYNLSCLPKSLGHLTSLQVLEIANCYALHQLPACLGELRSIRKLQISNLPGLTCLPQCMCGITSLEELTIENCPGLTSLPEGFQGLATLQQLNIIRCPDLERRCKGEDWHLISHIPYLQIPVSGNDFWSDGEEPSC